LQVPSAVDPAIRREGNIVCFDSDWQFPAVTELHAYRRMKQVPIPSSCTYVAFPWATLIDKLNTNAPDKKALQARFEGFCRLVPRSTYKVTVCQHIIMEKYLDLFRQCGIHEVFWSHARKPLGQAGGQGAGAPAIHPFPLYPVQMPEQPGELWRRPRPFLFSFVGAKSNRWYLTDVRRHILELLGPDPSGLVVGRDSWHYNRIVYDHQVSGRVAEGASLVDDSASEEFKSTLMRSVFSLCPSGTGPNSIRLWESLAAGSVPVVLADTWLPPGNQALWAQAAVFWPETRDAVAALPRYLRQIEADPERLAAMRHAGRQLWLQYGPASFVHDVQKRMVALNDAAAAKSEWQPRIPVHRLFAARAPSPMDARILLSVADADTLVNPRLANDYESDPQLSAGMQRTRLVLDEGTAKRLDALPKAAQRKASAASNPRVRDRRMRVWLGGAHAHRTPLAYLPFQRLALGDFEFVTDPDQADFLVSGFNVDIRSNAALFTRIWRKRSGARVVILSEEPLWDVTMSGGYAEQRRTTQLDDVEVEYAALNHHTSDVYAFARIPYFTLTNDDFLPRYATLLRQKASLKPGELLRIWQTAPVQAAFFAEVRDDRQFDVAYPEHGIVGLSVYRTKVARAVKVPGTMRVGSGWKAAPRRQALPDWHLDKLATLDGRARIVSAYENTHQRDYITEKIFDAFAVGAIPVYYAGPDHRISELVRPEAIVNTYGMAPPQAAARIAGFEPDRAYAEAWLDSVHALADRLSDPEASAAERRRVLSAIAACFERLA
jgi:hypothetical protein